MYSNEENSRHVGLQWDGSFHCDLGKCKETLRMILVMLNGEIPLLCKFKTTRSEDISVPSVTPHTLLFSPGTRQSHTKEEGLVLHEGLILRLTSMLLSSFAFSISSSFCSLRNWISASWDCVWHSSSVSNSIRAASAFSSATEKRSGAKEENRCKERKRGGGEGEVEGREERNRCSCYVQY